MKKVEIHLGEGNLIKGFPSATTRIYDESDISIAQAPTPLAEGKKILELHRDWKFCYEIFAFKDENSDEINHRGIEFEESGVTNVSESSCEETCNLYGTELSQWLLPIEIYLRLHIYPQDRIRIIIITNDDDTRRLHWNQWRLLDNYPFAECAVSKARFVRKKPQSLTPRNKVYILAVLGDDKNINLDSDRQALETLPNTEITWLIQPTREKFNQELRNPMGWDILFFAGHSQTLPKKAVIKLNATDYLNLEKLEYALRKAIDNGLQLAIFNSCDGSGLAKSLQNLDIPQVIVMNEVVPDFVAQEFLKNFLTEFSGGESMYLALRSAREQLQGKEENFFCASWLPKIFQNPVIVPPDWEELFKSPQDKATPPDELKKAKSLPGLVYALAPLVATISTIAIRSLGLLQGLELSAYDRTIKIRPDEGVDPNIAVVTVTERDIEEYGGYPLPDEGLANAIAKIQSLQPELIALDIFRDRPQQPGKERLRKILQKESNIIAVCSLAGFDDRDQPGIAPPPNIENYRVGFSEMAIDGDNVVRRHLLSSQPIQGSVCQADMSLSSRLAFYYLDRQDIQPEIVDGDLQLGDVRIKNLPNSIGGDRGKDDYGFQTMLNYRGGDRPFERISLQELLDGDVESNAIEGKIVLIGMDAPISTPDKHYTPLGKLPGVVIHAHMTSQIINAVLAKRPLITALSPWQENLLIAVMSIIGGCIIYRWQGLKAGVVILLIIPVTLGIGYIFLIQGLWLPIIPSTFALISTPLLARLYCFKSWQNKYKFAFKRS